MKSDYESVTEQAGIRAGKEGFDITVKENTHLKGGVIDGKAEKEKNNLTTGTLSWEDVKNKAEYKGSGAGVSYASKDGKTALNKKGLTLDFKPSVKDKADSTTKSAVAEGTIHITDKGKQKQDIAKLNRDTKDTLNQLSEIFDKKKVEEKQELMGMIGKYGNQAIHRYAERKGWKDGSTEKILLHGAFGALMSDMAGGSAMTGALSGGITEYVMGYLTKTKGEDWVQKHPDTVQWIGAGVGAAIGSLSHEVGIGTNISVNASKWNFLGFELPEVEGLLKETIVRKDGQEITEDELKIIHEIIYRTANKGDPDGAASDTELVLGSKIAFAGVKAVLQRDYTEESIDLFLHQYNEMVNGILGNRVSDQVIMQRPVHVNANKNRIEFDIYLVQYSAGPLEQSYIYDKKTDRFYVTGGYTKGNNLTGKGILGAEIAGIGIKFNQNNINLKERRIRNNILSGGSIGVTGYAGLGGGVSTPVSGDFVGEVLIFKYGVGTPQVSAGYDVAEEAPEENIPVWIRYLLKGF